MRGANAGLAEPPALSGVFRARAVRGVEGKGSKRRGDDVVHARGLAEADFLSA